jgi:CTD kinase subunit beta
LTLSKFLDGQNKRVLALERLIIESTRMDFRTRHPHQLALKLAKRYGLPRAVALKAYDLSMDLHRTWAPLKQNQGTMALACLELAARLCGADYKALYNASESNAAETLDSPRHLIIGMNSSSSRSHPISCQLDFQETMDELLDLYSFYRSSTLVGPSHTDDSFLKIKLDINRERRDLPSTSTSATDSSSHPAVRSIRESATVTSPSSPAPPRGTLSAVKDNTIRFVLNPQEMIEERLAQAQYLPPDLRKSEVPDWYVQWSDGKRTEVSLDAEAVPRFGKEGGPLDAKGDEIRVKNAIEAKKRIEKQVASGEFGRMAAAG